MKAIKKERIRESLIITSANQLQGIMFRIEGDWESDTEETDLSLLIELEDFSKHLSAIIRQYVKQERTAILG